MRQIAEPRSKVRSIWLQVYRHSILFLLHRKSWKPSEHCKALRMDAALGPDTTPRQPHPADKEWGYLHRWICTGAHFVFCLFPCSFDPWRLLGVTRLWSKGKALRVGSLESSMYPSQPWVMVLFTREKRVQIVSPITEDIEEYTPCFRSQDSSTVQLCDSV